MKKKRKQLNVPITLPNRFVPEFWEEQDHRCALTRAIRDRYETLKEHTQADSFQKDLLCRKAVFVSIRLETMEIEAAKTGVLDAGIYTQMLNCLIGLLKSLGLDRKAKKIPCLQEYVKGKIG